MQLDTLTFSEICTVLAFDLISLKGQYILISRSLLRRSWASCPHLASSPCDFSDSISSPSESPHDLHRSHHPHQGPVGGLAIGLDVLPRVPHQSSCDFALESLVVRRGPHRRLHSVSSGLETAPLLCCSLLDALLYLSSSLHYKIFRGWRCCVTHTRVKSSSLVVDLLIRSDD